jgi:hypothetical protein
MRKAKAQAQARQSRKRRRRQRQHSQRKGAQRSARIMGMSATLTYRFDEGEHPDLEAVRVVVGTGSMRTIGTHSRLVRLAGEVAATENKAELDAERATALAAAAASVMQPADGARQEGDEDDEDSDEAEAGPQPVPPDSEERPEDVVRVNLYRRWALLAAVTRKISIVKRGRKAKELDPEDPDKWPWQEASLEALGWDQPGPVVDLPADLFTSWELYAQRVNPGTFGPPLTGATKKKTGLISVI